MYRNNVFRMEFTLRRGYYNHALRQVAYLFHKVVLCIQEHTVMLVQVYANSFIGLTDYDYLEMGGPA